MPAKNPRVMVVMENVLHRWVKDRAKAEGISVSLKVRDLLKEAYETHEDEALGLFAAEREKTFKRKDALTTNEMRARLGIRTK